LTLPAPPPAAKGLRLERSCLFAREADSREVFRPFSALDTGSDREPLRRLALLTGLPHPSTRHSQVFFEPLSAFFFPVPSRPFFMPVALLGFSPSELSLRWNPGRLSAPAPLLSLRPGLLPANHGCPQPAFHRPLRRLQGFSPPARPCTRPLALARKPRSLLSWVLALQGSPTALDGLAFASPPLTCFGEGRENREGFLPHAPGTSESFSLRRVALSPKRLPSFLGFPPFSSFLTL